MNRTRALSILNKRKKYIDDDVFIILSDNIKKDLEMENEKFEDSISTLLKSGLDITVIKNIILSEFYDPKLLRDY